MESNNGIVCSSIGNRLGNQMCCIACGISFAKKYNKKFVFCSKENVLYNSTSYTEYKWIVDRFERLPLSEINGFNAIYEDNAQNFINFDEFANEDKLILYGVFQNDKYYDRNLIQEIFGNTKEDNERIYKKYGDLSNYVSMSVRRGDYLNLQSIFIVPKKEWYERAYRKYFEGSDILVSGDDLKWCKGNLNFENVNVHFLEEKDPVETLKIKQCCKKHIIPPSTYSWWSAYLSGEDSTVVAPNLWYTRNSGIISENKYPDGWLKEEL